MSKPLTMIALLVAVMAAIFYFVDIATGALMLLVIGALLLLIVGILTGR